MTDTDAIIDDPSELDAIWRKALVRSGIAYLFSRVCVIVGAAIIAAELRADENVRVAKFPWSRWADPHYADKAIPRNAVRPMLDVLTSWWMIWSKPAPVRKGPGHVRCRRRRTVTGGTVWPTTPIPMATSWRWPVPSERSSPGRVAGPAAAGLSPMPVPSRCYGGRDLPADRDDGAG